MTLVDGTQRWRQRSSVDSGGRILGGPSDAHALEDDLYIFNYGEGLRQGILSLQTPSLAPQSSIGQESMTAYADILRQVEVWPPSPDSDELGRLGPSDYGTAAAGEIAFRMLESGARLLLPSDISFDRDGAVRIVWEQGDKTLELVCPYEQSQRPYLFYSNDDQHGIAHDLSKTRLNRLLSWLNGKLTEFPR